MDRSTDRIHRKDAVGDRTEFGSSFKYLTRTVRVEAGITETYP